MAYYLEKEKTGSTPYILVDEKKGYIRFEGESFHENVVSFYRDFNEWLESYLKSDFDALTFDCELKYFNSSTAKLLLNILLEMDDCTENGKKITVNWITTKDNEVIVECGEDFQEELNNLDFNLIIN